MHAKYRLQWKFPYLLAAAAACLFAWPSLAADEFQPTAWRLGMPRDAALAGWKGAAEPVDASTERVQISGGTFAGQPAKITLVFARDKLAAIEALTYEGPSYDAARGAAIELTELFYRELGGLQPGTFRGPREQPFPRESVPKLVDASLGRARTAAADIRRSQQAEMLFTLDVLPRHQPTGRRLHGQWVYESRTGTYRILLFEEQASAPPRDAPANIQLLGR
jgi:hypothetical protein